MTGLTFKNAIERNARILAQNSTSNHAIVKAQNDNTNQNKVIKTKCK